MSREQITAGVDEAARKLGGLHILINNASGVIAEKPAHLDPRNHGLRAFEDNLFLTQVSDSSRRHRETRSGRQFDSQVVEARA